MRQRKRSPRKWTLIWQNKKRKEWRGYLFLLPSLAGTVWFVFLPFLDVVRRSFFQAVGSGFVGFANYRAVFANEAFHLAVGNTARFMVTCVPALLALSLGAAVLLQQTFSVGRQERAGRMFRMGFLAPVAVPAASAVIFFRLVFDRGGWLNGLMEALGAGERDWLGTGSAFWVLTGCYIWKNLGYDMVLWLAGLSSIPAEQYEAAKVQGAGKAACFLWITLPQLKETAFVTALLSFINGFRVFREAYLIAGDYPHESIYMLQHLFNNWFTGLDIQKMSAAAVMLVLLTGGILIANEIHAALAGKKEERS